MKHIFDLEWILNNTRVVVHVPVQLDSLTCIDSRQIGPGLIWLRSNWDKESQYGLNHETKEQNELTGL